MSYFFAESGPPVVGEPAEMESLKIGDKVEMVNDDDGLVLEIIGIDLYGRVEGDLRNAGRPGAIQAACLIKEGIMKGANGMALAVPGHLLYLKEHQMIAI
jgi:hypothetical protein